MKKDLEHYFDRLWPICRSITGEGYRRSLDILSELMPSRRLRFRTGKKVFDWTVPEEWVVRNAYFVDPKGRKHADFKKNNLHLLNYSAPFRGKLPLAELKKHLYSLPELPDAVPYLTSYYQRRWGFCLTHRELQTLTEGSYEVFIDTGFKNGNVEIGETVLHGESEKEVLFSSYLCHPSMANNELSGPLVLAFLYQKIKAMKKRKYTYRFALMPETIGSLCYLSVRGNHLKKNLIAGYQLTCIGDRGRFTYKETPDGHTLTDRIAKAVLRTCGKHKIISYDPSMGSDERQYGSPGFRLPVGSLMRTMYAAYSEYHTSLDNKKFISFDALEESVKMCFLIVQAVEKSVIYKNRVRFGEPQLGKRGLYPTLGSQKHIEQKVRAMMWILNCSDGKEDLQAIARKSGQTIGFLTKTAEKLQRAGLLEKRGKR